MIKLSMTKAAISNCLTLVSSSVTFFGRSVGSVMAKLLTGDLFSYRQNRVDV
jgi:hypothetical protein